MTEAASTAVPSPATPSDRDESLPLAAGARVLKSEDILQGSSEIFIQHGPQVYRLRQTKTGKLLLYK